MKQLLQEKERRKREKKKAKQQILLGNQFAVAPPAKTHGCCTRFEGEDSTLNRRTTEHTNTHNYRSLSKQNKTKHHHQHPHHHRRRLALFPFHSPRSLTQQQRGEARTLTIDSVDSRRVVNVAGVVDITAVFVRR